MTQQLSLFPDSPSEIFKAAADETLADVESLLNPVDEMFAACRRFRNRDHVIDLLCFIGRFPGY